MNGPDYKKCSNCGGDGRVLVGIYETVKCAFCLGQGVIPVKIDGEGGETSGVYSLSD